MSYFDWMCLYWAAIEKLDESTRAWESCLTQLLRPHAVFILSCCVIAPLSRPSARWNGFLPRAFFFAGTHFRRANQRTTYDQKVEFYADIHVLEHGRLCWQSLHLVSVQMPWSDKLGHSKEDARRGEVGEAVDCWHAFAAQGNGSQT